ncbi:zinc-binding dehydrogenase [Eubacteriales bacterium OttesenSCG-928-N14]|nr:zinc-binding dehydrogenase [Eubacteriales bacterium OttesenSCG-928-N14]
MSMVGKEIVFGAIMEEHKAELHKVVLPPLQPGELLLKMEKINLCTTDYQHWMGLRNHYGFPRAAGHEYAGIIVEKGNEVTEDFAIGDRVSGGYASCGYCEYCLEGYSSECKNKPGDPYGRYAKDFRGGKAFANYMILDQRGAVKVSNKIPAEQASFLEPAATVVECMHKARLMPAETVVVVGAGTMGIVNAQVANAYGARVIVSDISDKKVECAKGMSIAEVIHAGKEDPVAKVMELTEGKGADVVIAAVGSTIAYKQCLQMLRHFRGRFIIFPAGYPKPELNIDPNEMHYRKMEVIGAYESNDYGNLVASRLLSYGKIDMSYALEGKTFPLSKINEAFAAAATPDSYRVTIDLQDI